MRVLSLGPLVAAAAAALCGAACDGAGDGARDDGGASSGVRRDSALEAAADSSNDARHTATDAAHLSTDAAHPASDAARPQDAAHAKDAGGDGTVSDASHGVDAPVMQTPSDAGDAGYLPGRPEILCASADPPAPPESTFITNASVQVADSLGLPSTGDLWPSCWSGNALYAAWGDGFGFSDAGAYPRPSIGVARIVGDPANPTAMSGQTLVHDSEADQAIFKVWSGGGYYQKPTGMLCTSGQIFLAVQDLNESDYGDAPAATIAVSADSGQTWSERTSAPMFDHHEFTTVMFLDYGQDRSWAVDGYIYVYGLDYNWRWSPTVASPQGLYLARVGSAAAVLDRSSWEYFGGTDSGGDPVWVTDFALRLPVLVDCSRRYATSIFAGYTVISQGSVVYDAPRQRYLYTSWTEYTFEFYEAPTPWGPWKKFLYQDFGLPPWTTTHNGGYATSIPSKFIDPDGGAMWVQSNTWSSGVDENSFELRTLQL